MKTGNRRLGLFAVLIAGVTLGLSGCIKIDETLTLNRDGSGTFHIVYGMAERTLAELQAMKALAREMDTAAGKKDVVQSENVSGPFLFDEPAIRKMFKAYQEYGIQLEAVELDTRNGWKYAYLTIAFKSVLSLNKIAFMAQDGFSIVKAGDGAYTLSQQFKAGDSILDMSDPEVEKSMGPILAGFQVTSKVTIPGIIRDTNASRHTDDTAFWDIDFDKDPQLIGQLQKDGMRLVFDGRGLNLAPAPIERPAPSGK